MCQIQIILGFALQEPIWSYSGVTTICSTLRSRAKQSKCHMCISAAITQLCCYSTKAVTDSSKIGDCGCDKEKPITYTPENVNFMQLTHVAK